MAEVARHLVQVEVGRNGEEELKPVPGQPNGPVRGNSRQGCKSGGQGGVSATTPCGTAIHSNRMMASVETGERERLVKLDAARQRLHEPNFGVCSRCGRSIAVERLLVMPESRICVPCKQALTKK